jgi:hypothetical protein
MQVVGLGGEAQAARRRHLIRYAYAAATTSACLAAALFLPQPGFPGTRLGAIREAVQEIGIASIGLWFAAGRDIAAQPAAMTFAVIDRRWIWIAASMLIFIAFAVTMGRGVL